MKKRVVYCDILRIISIIGIICLHLMANMRDAYLILNKKYYFILTCLDSIPRFAVPIFFMITGAFMLGRKNKESYKEFLKKRIPKLLIPLVIFCVIYYIYDGMTLHSRMSLIDFWNKFSSGLEIKYHLWFMYSIITIYLFIPFLQQFIEKIDKKDLRTLIIVIFIFGNLINTINVVLSRMETRFLTAFKVPDLLIYMNYTFLGYYLFKYDIKLEDRKKAYIIGIISLILMPIFDYICTVNIREDSMLLALSIFPFFYAIAVFLFAKYNLHKVKISAKNEKYINKIANSVFYIYLVHVLVIEVSRKVINNIYVPQRFIGYSLQLIIHSFIVIIISFALGLLIDYLMNLRKKQFKKIG